MNRQEIDYIERVPFPIEKLNSQAFKGLTNSARVTLLLLHCEVRDPRQNVVVLTPAQAEHHMNRRTFAKAIRQLEESGFIKNIEIGDPPTKSFAYMFVDGWREVS